MISPRLPSIFQGCVPARLPASFVDNDFEDKSEIPDARPVGSFLRFFVIERPESTFVAGTFEYLGDAREVDWVSV